MMRWREDIAQRRVELIEYAVGEISEREWLMKRLLEPQLIYRLAALGTVLLLGAMFLVLGFASVLVIVLAGR